MFVQALVDGDARTVKFIVYGIKIPYAEGEYKTALRVPLKADVLM